MRQADAVEIVVGQGAKPGTGGALLGMKVSEEVANMRTLPVGVSLQPCQLGDVPRRPGVSRLRQSLPPTRLSPPPPSPPQSVGFLFKLESLRR